jgi:hypothetical protein
MDLRPVWGSPIKIKKGIDTNERLRGEAPPVEDTRVLLTLQKHLYRSGLFGTDGQSSKIELARLRRKLGVEPVSAQEAIRVAGAHGRRPEIYRSLTWMALVELSSPSLPADARAEFESKIAAGSRFTHTQIRGRRPLKKPARRMAA